MEWDDIMLNMKTWIAGCRQKIWRYHKKMIRVQILRCFVYLRWEYADVGSMSFVVGGKEERNQLEFRLVTYLILGDLAGALELDFGRHDR